MNMTVIHNSDPRKHKESITISHPPRVGEKMLLFFDSLEEKYFVVTDVLYITMPDESYAPKYIYVDTTEELTF